MPAINSPNYTWLAIWLSGALSKNSNLRLEIACDIATRPRAEVLSRWAGLKITKSQLRTVNRLQRSCLCAESGNNLFSILKYSTKSRSLQHCKTITPDYLADLAQIPPNVFTGNIAKFLHHPKSLQNLLHIRCLLVVRNDEQARMRFLRALSQTRTRREFDHLLKSAPFLIAPFPGNDTLKPIRNVRELNHQGRTLGQCLGDDHEERVQAGYTYYYAWQGAESATVEFVCTEAGEWLFSQAYCRDNELPANETLLQILMVVVGEYFSNYIQ